MMIKSITQLSCFLLIVFIMLKQAMTASIKFLCSVMALFIFIAPSANAVLYFELGPAPGYNWLSVTGSPNPSKIYFTDPSWGGNIYSSYYNYGVTSSTGGGARYYVGSLSCDGVFTSQNAILGFLDTAISNRTFQLSTPNSNSGPLYSDATVYLSMGCWDAINKKGVVITAGGSADGFEIINPPAPNAVCSLNSQNLNLYYSSTSLNVNGLTQNANLSVSCTTGNAQNYTLRLTGSNVSNGRLSFGNGVTAQVYLNGTAVSANSSGITLNGLTSQGISVRADLLGSASNSGTTTATGILILDAL